MTEVMKFAYADPPYLGCGDLYDHPHAKDWNCIDKHKELMVHLLRNYEDGFAISLHVPSLPVYLAFLETELEIPSLTRYRLAAWVKPFAVFKPNVTRAYTWEPVIFYGGREITRDQPTWRDHLSCPITLKKGLVGAKPAKFCSWILDGLNFQPGDVLDDLFPGTGVMSEVIAARNGQMPQEGLFNRDG